MEGGGTHLEMIESDLVPNDLVAKRCRMPVDEQTVESRLVRFGLHHGVGGVVTNIRRAKMVAILLEHINRTVVHIDSRAGVFILLVLTTLGHCFTQVRESSAKVVKAKQ